MSDLLSTVLIDPFGGNSIDYNDLKKKLLELQPNLVFDEGSGRCVYMFAEGKMRAGLYYNKDYISAVERGAIPELSLYDKWEDQVIPASPQEVLAEPDGTKAWFEEIWVTREKDPQNFMVLDQWLGIEPIRILKYPKTEVMVQRENGCCIVISNGFRKVSLPSHVLRIGWREVLERLLDARIPNITKNALEKKFNVDLSGPRRSGLQLEVAMAGVPTMT